MGAVLGLDTSTFLLQAALLWEDGTVAAELREEVPTHTPRLPGALEGLLQMARLSASDLLAVGVTRGPGSFTGLRVGLAAALGLGKGLRIPVYGLSTLVAVARACPAGGRGAVLLDARRGEVYVQPFLREAGGVRPLADARSLPPATLDRAGFDWAAGDGIALVAEWPPPCRLFPGVGGAAVQAALHALQEWAAGREPAPLSPLYVRPPDVREPGR
jgi:tRNA threonylcarbamoyladenosine biosynthesis protein TsaB